MSTDLNGLVNTVTSDAMILGEGGGGLQITGSFGTNDLLGGDASDDLSGIETFADLEKQLREFEIGRPMQAMGLIMAGVGLLTNNDYMTIAGFFVSLSGRQIEKKAIELELEINEAILLDPLVIDLDGDGVELDSILDSTAFFDMDADGFAEATAWVGADDGVLVIDRDGDGIISDLTEVFSELYSDAAESGLGALSALDANVDGVFDALDSQFNDVRVWRDLDQDGETDAGELFDLTALGIAAIDLVGAPGAGTAAGGNVVVTDTTFTRADGTTGAAADVGLLVAPADFTRVGAENGFVLYQASDGSLTAVAETDTAAAVDLAQAGYAGVIGRGGADTFSTSGAGAIAAIGGAGDDVLTGGAGDDLLSIDADDLSVDGGEGTDFAFVTSDTALTLDLAATNLEGVISGGDAPIPQ